MAYDFTKSMPGPENILRREFPNGMTVLAHEKPMSGTAALEGSIPAGSYLEPEGKNGLTSFLTGCLTTGTLTHSFQEINGALEEIGASLAFSAGPRSISVSGHCVAEDLPVVLRLLREVLEEPAFPEEHFEIYRKKALSAFELHLHDPESMTDERFDEMLYGDTPYGRSRFGSAAVISAMTRDEAAAFHRRYIGPKGMKLSVSGGIRADEIMDLCGQILGTWDKKQETVDPAGYFPQVDVPFGPMRDHVEIPEKSEMSLVIGTFGPKRSDPDYTAAVLGNAILGELGMMGRIGYSVREKNGLAYYVSSSVDSMTYGGCWSVEAGVNPANVDKAADLIMKELKRFKSEKVTPEELEDVKSSALGGLPLALENNGGTAAMILSMEILNRGLDYLIRTPERIRAVTDEDILESANRWLDFDKMIRITAGTAAA